MKKMHASILIIFFISIAIPAFSFNNEPDNFRGIKWGSNLTELRDMRSVESADDMKFCKRKNDKLKIGPAKITDLVYVFYKGKFSGVMIKYDEYSNFSIIKEAFSQLYGNGFKNNRFMERYWWLGADVDIKLDYNEIADKGSIGYTYKPIAGEKAVDNAKSAKTAKDDL